MPRPVDSTASVNSFCKRLVSALPLEKTDGARHAAPYINNATAIELPDSFDFMLAGVVY